ncbi:hypothetical protein QWY75_12455 [Pontixanthobacter aestiaquae]|uniref:Uncharacterized protein n=1 Tax=Pontixanthobacter aestiaquae TaxID=1509367 RepID=A0A844Z404_9SPHN|nr:hypothetical protein [Pontixanthobacter aestiaquae]MDN3647016.1 hypothetical protein [Pontixanthobacter aestiaquae]MXO82006.1 hypothetical protein [Pontixanthobacter aestiaquae]
MDSAKKAVGSTANHRYQRAQTGIGGFLWCIRYLTVKRGYFRGTGW